MKVPATKTWKELMTGVEQLVRLLFNKTKLQTIDKFKTNFNSCKITAAQWVRSEGQALVQHVAPKIFHVLE